MLWKSLAKFALIGAVAITSLSPAWAAKRKVAGACANSIGRCIACDSSSWCQVYTCTNGQSTAAPFWKCYEPSGFCYAPFKGLAIPHC